MCTHSHGVLSKHLEQNLSTAVLGILITSPIGAIGIVLAGPRMLERSPPPVVEVDGALKQSAESSQKPESPFIETTV